MISPHPGLVLTPKPVGGARGGEPVGGSPAWATLQEPQPRRVVDIPGVFSSS